MHISSIRTVPESPDRSTPFPSPLCNNLFALRIIINQQAAIMASRQERSSSFVVVGGANPEEETKESESVIFYRGRPNVDRYREDYDDDDPGSFFHLYYFITAITFHPCLTIYIVQKYNQKEKRWPRRRLCIFRRTKKKTTTRKRTIRGKRPRLLRTALRIRMLITRHNHPLLLPFRKCQRSRFDQILPSRRNRALHPQSPVLRRSLCPTAK